MARPGTRGPGPGMDLGSPGGSPGGRGDKQRTMGNGVYIYIIWVCLKMSCTPKPNGFADHYPY